MSEGKIESGESEMKWSEIEQMMKESGWSLDDVIEVLKKEQGKNGENVKGAYNTADKVEDLEEFQTKEAA
jgi:hypothetical protein